MRRTIREREPAPPSTRLGTLPEDERTTTAHRQRVEPAKLVSQLRGDLDWIVLKALEKDRTRRYATANDLALDIRRYLDNEPILARPPSAAYRFRKLVRRNKLLFAGTSAVAAALVIGLALSAWQYVEKSAAYRRIRGAVSHCSTSAARRLSKSASTCLPAATLGVSVPTPAHGRGHGGGQQLEQVGEFLGFGDGPLDGFDQIGDELIGLASGARSRRWGRHTALG